MPTILVMQESPSALRQIQEVLEGRADFRVISTCDSAETLQEMASSQPDLVVIDLETKNGRNLELVSNLREDYPFVPIILMTAESNTKAAVESLRRGASSYVPRQTIDAELLPTIESLLNLITPRRNRSGACRAMLSCSHSFRLPNDYEMISAVVSYLEQTVRDLGTCDEADCVRVSVALLEALSNALYHGNLELESRLREQDLEAYQDEARRRVQTAPYRDRRIFVDSRLSKEKVEFVIRDEGQGFDPEQLPDLPDGPNLDRLSGRGIMLMRTIMDEVHFSPNGTQVTLVKHCTGTVTVK